MFICWVLMSLCQLVCMHMMAQACASMPINPSVPGQTLLLGSRSYDSLQVASFSNPQAGLLCLQSCMLPWVHNGRMLPGSADPIPSAQASLSCL